MSNQVNTFDIKKAIESVQARIDNAALKVGRSASKIKLMAVSKYHSIDEVKTALDCGIRLFGENHVQEAVSKFPTAFGNYTGSEVHMIGTLQRNKVKSIIPIADCIQSVDRIELIDEIEKQASKSEKKIKILLEYHTGEESKSGFPTFDEMKKALELLSDKEKYAHIIPSGFMTMAPFTNDTKTVRESFIKLRTAAEKLQDEFKNFNLRELSMGMSSDFETAIEEGSTLVRIGTAIFGARLYPEAK